MRIRETGSLFCLLATASLGQPATRPAFETASVRVYPSGAKVPPEAQGFTQSPDGIRAIHVTLRGCLQWAYSIVDVSGPSWIIEESYDIVAKAERPVPGPELRLMLQTLLEDRFQLKVHRETKRSPVRVLVVSKSGIKNLRPVEGGGTFELKRADAAGIQGNVEMRNASMVNVASVLGSPFGNMPLERVDDGTGLNGRYDLTLNLRGFDPRDPAFRGYQEMRDALSQFVSEELDRQYGLKLERRIVPVDVLVVDGGNRVPAPN